MNAEITFKTGKTITIENVKEIRQQRRGENVETVKPENYFVLGVPTIFIGKQILTVSDNSVEYVGFYD